MCWQKHLDRFCCSSLDAVSHSPFWGTTWMVMLIVNIYGAPATSTWSPYDLRASLVTIIKEFVRIAKF